MTSDRQPYRWRPLRAESGFSLIEVMAATFVLVVGLLGIVGAFDSARKLNVLSERRTSAAHRAQLEIERLQTLSYSELAMHEAPSHSTSNGNPDYYVKEGGTEYQYGVKEEEAEKLVTPGGVIYATPSGRKCSETVGACEWGEGNLTGNVYDFVTWHPDTNAKCTKTEDYKRLTVVVTVKVPSGSREVAPTRVSTLIVNPKEIKTEFEGC
jgi:hypothetical protein